MHFRIDLMLLDLLLHTRKPLSYFPLLLYLQKILKHYLDEEHLVTEYIDGVEYTIDVLVNTNGDFIFSVPRERTSTNAVSVSGKIVMDDILIQFSKDVVDKFNFIGPINNKESEKKFFLKKFRKA